MADAMDEYLKLIEGYRLDQMTVTKAAGDAVKTYWRATTPGEADSEQTFVKAATTAVMDSRLTSQRIARDFWIDQTEALDLGGLDLIATDVDDAYREQVEKSLGYIGPVRARRRIAFGDTPEEARSGVAKSVTGAVVRHVGNAGRQIIKDGAERVEVGTGVEVGWMRVTTSVNPCYFCVALASRGPDYRARSFKASDARFEGPGQVKVHDSCRCAYVLTRSSHSLEWTPQNRAFERMWQEMSDGDRDKTPMQNFRNNYNAYLKANGGRLPQAA